MRARRRWLMHCSVLGLALAGSASQGAPAAKSAATNGATSSGAANGAANGGAATTRVILIVGDSLSAEYGLARGTGWVALLEQRLVKEQLPAKVINASISGDTTSGGRSRLADLLKAHRPSHVVIELGGNDALRGLPLDMTRANLSAMAQAAKAAQAKVMLLGMQVPPNYGGRYGRDFAALFADIAKAQGAALVPFLLAGVADSAQAETLFQPDRIHPAAQAHPTMANNVWVVLKPWLR